MIIATGYKISTRFIPGVRWTCESFIAIFILKGAIQLKVNWCIHKSMFWYNLINYWFKIQFWYDTRPKVYLHVITIPNGDNLSNTQTTNVHKGC